MPIVKRTGWANQEVGELARSVDDSIRNLTALKVIRFTRIYAEPMTLAFDHEPLFVFVNAKVDSAPEESVIHNPRVSFKYIRRELTLNEIEGLTVGTKYRFAILLIG